MIFVRVEAEGSLGDCLEDMVKVAKKLSGEEGYIGTIMMFNGTEYRANKNSTVESLLKTPSVDCLHCCGTGIRPGVKKS